VQLASGIEQRQHRRAIGCEAQTVRAHGLAGQVGRVAVRSQPGPHQHGAPRGCLRRALTLGVGAATVFGQAPLQGGALLIAELAIALAQLHLLRAAVVAAPHAIGADDQQIAAGHLQFVQRVPATLLPIPLHLAADHAARLQRVDQKASVAQLAQHILIIGGHSVSGDPAVYTGNGVRITRVGTRWGGPMTG